MSAQYVHHQIETLQQQMASLRSAVTSPVQDQGGLLERLAALQVSLQALHIAAGQLHQQHDELVVVHQQAEAVLRDSEARTHAILQTAVDGIITIDERGIVESFNPAAECLFGYSADEVIGQNISMLMPSPVREAREAARRPLSAPRRAAGAGSQAQAAQRNLVLQTSVVSLNCRDAFPQTMGKDAPGRATHPGSEAERDRTTVRSLSRRDPSVWPP
jgi:PAS domain-containing protein